MQAVERVQEPGPGTEMEKGTGLGLDCLWMKTAEGLYKQVQAPQVLKLERQEREPQVLELELAQRAQKRQLEELDRRVLALLLLEPEVRLPDRMGQLGHECGSVDGNSRASMPMLGNSLVERR